MAGYTAISDTGRTIVEFLRKNCIPPVEKSELIGLCDPNDTGSYIVGVCLYDIEEDADTRASRSDIVIDETHVQSPPSPINLHYMIFTALKSDIAIRAQDEQRILGRIYQKLADNRVITDCLQGSLAESGEQINIAFENKPFEDKIKVWTAYNMPPKPALFYRVTTLLVDSEKIREVKRVTTADISVRQRGVRR